MKTTKRFLLSLPLDVHESVLREALSRGRSMTSVMNNILFDHYFPAGIHHPKAKREHEFEADHYHERFKDLKR